MAEYFDASDVIPYETSSEAEASDESGLSDITTTSNSEPDEGHGQYWHALHLFLFFKLLLLLLMCNNVCKTT